MNKKISIRKRKCSFVGCKNLYFESLNFLNLKNDKYTEILYCCFKHTKIMYSCLDKTKKVDYTE